MDNLKLNEIAQMVEDGCVDGEVRAELYETLNVLVAKQAKIEQDEQDLVFMVGLLKTKVKFITS